jgi:L-threonylcarbamoyladenylate synthase
LRSRLSEAVSSSADPSMLAAAIAALRAGELVIYPTETFYGIAADPESPDALEKIFALKGREVGKPIALIAADTASAFGLAREIPPMAHRLAAAFWPGPLTIVLPARAGLHEAVVGPSGVGVRVSSHLIARALAAGLGRPITATSANRSGQAPIADPATVRDVLGTDIEVILEDGVLSGGAPSTVIEIVGRAYRIVRAGAISDDAIVAATGLRAQR